MHSRKLIYWDLKAQNLFLIGNLTVKLEDFDVSRVLENSNNATIESPIEAIENRQRNFIVSIEFLRVTFDNSNIN